MEPKEIVEYVLRIDGLEVDRGKVSSMIPSIPFQDLEKARKFKYGILIIFPNVKISIYERTVKERRIDD